MLTLVKLNGLIASKDIKKTYLAKELNMTIGTLGKKLKGKSNFTIEEAYKLSQIFDTTLTELFIY